MKFRNSVLVALTSFVVMFTSSAVLAEGMKIGYIDMQIVLQKSKKYKDTSRKIEDEFMPRKDEMDKKVKVFQDKQANFEKNKDTMSQKELASVQKDLSKMYMELQKMEQSIRNDLMNRQRDESDSFIASVTDTAEQVSKKEGLKLVVFRESFIYQDGLMDITDKVLEILNKN